MIDLIEMGRRLWESGAAEAADVAENQQPQRKQPAEALLKTAESAPLQQNQQHFSNPKVTASPHAVGFSAESAESAAANRAESEKPRGLLQWIEWIAEQCPLLADDRTFVAGKLALLPSDGQEIAARRYVKAWLAGADAEPRPVRKENAGRLAANQTLLRFSQRPMPSRGGGRVQQQSTVSLAPGERMAWHLRINGKPVVMTGRPMTKDQALESARSRWPGAQVEVTP